mmetsp:Transcript_384/g.1169  ORF Transcript_384/g.1169 Transcript_384/m.1169 type:complete len:760 (-) Transcript_384:87-2366(-)
MEGGSGMVGIPPWAAAPERARYELVVRKDGVEVGTVALRKAVAVIGREAGCDYVMEHPSVSRRHVALVQDGGKGVYAVDLGSMYGTTVDGSRLSGEAKLLEAGSTVRVGMSSRTLSTRETREEAEMPEGLPGSFGSQRKRPAGDDVEAARARLAERRRAREAEIAALTREMVSSKPSWRAVERDEDAAVVVEDVAEDEAPREAQAEEEEEAGEGDGSAGAIAKRWSFPVSHEITLGSAGRKTVSCLAVDPGGARIVVGSLDAQLRFYDFGGMDKEHRAFRETEADEGHAPVAVSFSPSGDRFLCCTASAQPQIMTRDGKFLIKFTRGDPYVRDVTRTNGHVTTVTGGSWQPGEKMRCATSSVDGSVRLWDLCGKTGLRDYLYCESTLRCKDKAARKTSATAVAFEPSGKIVAAGCADGSVQYWQVRGRGHSYSRPDACARGAHTPGTDASGSVLSCVKFSPDGRVLATRADDGFLKLWDLRTLGKTTPLAAFADVPGYAATLDWSPDGAVVVAGTDDGRLRFFSAGGAAHEIFRAADGYAPLLSLAASSQPVPVVLWHSRIRHLFCGAADGAVKALYDPDLSSKGALLSVRRDHAARRTARDAVLTADPRLVADGAIVNPNALPMFRNDHLLKGPRYAKTRADSKASRLPDKPLDQGQQGRNTGARSTFSQFYLERHLPENIRDQDPRDQLLKYANHPPIFRTDATYYTDASGARVFADKTLDQEADAFLHQQQRLLQADSRHTDPAANNAASKPRDAS